MMDVFSFLYSGNISFFTAGNKDIGELESHVSNFECEKHSHIFELAAIALATVH